MATQSKWLIDKSEAVGQRGMVTAMQPDAAEVGAEILRQGGNAVDAAVAVTFAIGVVEPFMSGLGGIAFMVYHDAGTGETTCLDGSSKLPSGLQPDMFEILPDGGTSGLYGWPTTKNDAAQTGWLAPAVPGMPDLCWQAHQRWGKLPWKDIIAPAIALAENGFSFNHYVSLSTVSAYERLSKFPESKKTFFKPNGAPYAPGMSGVGGGGDKFVQPDLARTLRLVADEGAETVYRGEIARMIAEDMARNGGVITEDDLAAHETLVHEATVATYRDAEVVAQIQNTGNATVIEALKILEGFDIGKMGFQSPEATHLIAEAIRHAFVDRLRWLGDAELQPVPYQGVISEDYAAKVRSRLNPDRATPEAEPGDPWPFDPGNPGASQRSGNGGEGNTTHLNVVDSDGNTVSLTSTLGALFGSAVVVKGTGITLNNGTMWFDPRPGAVTSIGPNKRILSAASPLLLMRDGKPLAALGSPGGRRVVSAVYQMIVNLIDFNRGMQGAVSAPRLHSEGPATDISSRFPEATLQELERLGHQLAIHEESLSNSHFARPSGILIDQRSGELRGGVHQYTPATAVGI